MLTKARYVALHDDDPHFRRSAAAYWDRAIAPGHDAIPRALIVGKQDELRRALEHVARYASEHVAHTAGQPRGGTMTFEDVRRAMATAVKIFRWCAMVLRAEGHLTPVPSTPAPWLRVFRVPWLEPGRPVPAYRSFDELIREGDRRRSRVRLLPRL